MKVFLHTFDSITLYCVVRQAPVISVMAPPIHLGAWSMALMLWLPFEYYYQTLYFYTPLILPNLLCSTKHSKLHCILSAVHFQYYTFSSSLFDIEFNKLNWRVFITFPSAQSGLNTIRGRVGELLSKVWRIVE